MRDNYDLWKDHDTAQERQLNKMPVCSYCNEHVQDDFYEINDEVICQDCLDRYFKKYIDDYIE